MLIHQSKYINAFSYNQKVSKGGHDIRTVNCKIGARDCNIESDDKYLEHIGKVFEAEIVRLYSALIDPTMHVLDVGANIGCTSILFSDLGKSVVSIEPSPTTYALLQRNLGLNRAGSVEALNFGLGDRRSRLELMFSGTNRSGAFIANQTKASSDHITEAVEIITGDSLYFRGQRPLPDFVKIDVEGFELATILGLRETLDVAKPIVFLELNHWCLNAFQRISVPEFFDKLSEQFPVLIAIHGNQAIALDDESSRYKVMYQHITKGKFSNLAAAFTDEQRDRIIRACG